MAVGGHRNFFCIYNRGRISSLPLLYRCVPLLFLLDRGMGVGRSKDYPWWNGSGAWVLAGRPDRKISSTGVENILHHNSIIALVKSDRPISNINRGDLLARRTICIL